MEDVRVDIIINTVEKEPHILAAYLFGSYAAGRPNKFSDVDIAVLFDEDLAREYYTDKQIFLAMSLTKALNKETDIIILNTASSFLKYHILKSGARVYEKPGRNGRGFEAKATIEYFEFLPVKSRIENGLLAKIKEASGGQSDYS